MPLYEAHGCLSGQQSPIFTRSLGLQLPSTLLILLHNPGSIGCSCSQSVEGVSIRKDPVKNCIVMMGCPGADVCSEDFVPAIGLKTENPLEAVRSQGGASFESFCLVLA